METISRKYKSKKGTPGEFDVFWFQSPEKAEAIVEWLGADFNPRIKANGAFIRFTVNELDYSIDLSDFVLKDIFGQPVVYEASVFQQEFELIIPPALEYIRRKTTIQAMQFDGTEESGQKIVAWVSSMTGRARYHDHEVGSGGYRGITPFVTVETLPGAAVSVTATDWVVSETPGEFKVMAERYFKENFISSWDAETQMTSDVLKERQRQVEKGYDAWNDVPQGIGRLIRMAYDYGIAGDTVKATAMNMAVLNVLSLVRAQNPETDTVRI